MALIDLVVIASMPIVKILLISLTGLILALDSVDILGEVTLKHLNKVVFYVFSPALITSNLAKTITLESILTLWFMPVNIFVAFLIGTVLGWTLFKLTKAPKHLKGIIIASCSAGNLGKLPIILLPAMCREKGNPFGAVDVCESYALAYASLSMALAAIFMWSYVYNIIRIFSNQATEEVAPSSFVERHDTLGKYAGSLIVPSVNDSLINPYDYHVPPLSRVKQWLTEFSIKINLKAILSPSIIAAIIGFIIAIISPLQKLLIGNGALLHVVQDSVYIIGQACVPCIILILGANLLKGLKKSNIQFSIVAGIAIVRFILLPPLGIIVVKSAIRFGILQCEPLFQFLLLLQYSTPPAMNIGTMTQLFGIGNTEYSTIVLWTYGLAIISLTIWCTIFLWLVVP